MQSASDLSARNKAVILAYCECVLYQVCGTIRLTRALVILRLWARLLGKDLDQATKDDRYAEQLANCRLLQKHY